MMLVLTNSIECKNKTRERTKIGFACIVALVFSHFLASRSYGQITTKNWNNPALSSWTIGSNWLPSGVPAASTTVFFNDGGTAELNGASGQALDIHLGLDVAFPGHLRVSRTTVPGSLVCQNIYVGDSGAASTFVADGVGVACTATADFIVGYAGQGNSTIQNGATVVSNRGLIGVQPTGVGEGYLLGGAWTIQDELLVGDLGSGTLIISDGATVSNGSYAFIGSGANSIGNVTVTGTGSTWTNAGPSLDVGGEGWGELRILDGGSVSTNLTYVGSGVLNNSNGSVIVSGAGSTWNNSNFVFVDASGIASAAVTIEDHGTVNLNQFIIGAHGTINLSGGILNANYISTLSTGSIHFASGTIHLTGDQAFVSSEGVGKGLGEVIALTWGKHLVVDGKASISIPTTLDGGTATFGQLTDVSSLELKRGTLTLVNQAVAVEAGGLFGEVLVLRPDLTINVNSGLTNHGLITGSGRLGGPFANAAGAEIRSTAGTSITFTGAVATNDGDVRLIDGLVEFNSALTNSATGRITGRGTLSVGGTGLANNGHLALSSGITDIFGNVVNNTGNASSGITVSGNADVTFWDDVNNVAGSLFRVSAGSSATFFGTFSGAGISGPGSVYFEADVTPGASPATASFGGNLSLGVAATLVIELGGTAPGTQYDQLQVAGALSLNGTLQVALINGFNPSNGQSFDLLDWGTLTGTFSSILLPTLTGDSTWNTSQLYTTGVISVVASVVPGDFDSDGDVDGADFVAWQTNFPRGSGATLPQGDSDGDGDVDGADFVAWKTHFPFAPSPGAAPVPEPNAALLLLTAGVGLAILAFRRSMKSAPRFVELIAIIICVNMSLPSARADIYQWEWVNPSDHSLGKQPSGTLCVDGAGVSATPNANLIARNLTMAHLIGANLNRADFSDSIVSAADFAGANLENARFIGTSVGAANFSNANVRSALFWFTSGFTKEQLYSTASYQAQDLQEIGLGGSDLANCNFAGQNLSYASLYQSKLSGAVFDNAIVQGTDFSGTTQLGFTKEQLYSTASYKNHGLELIDLSENDLKGWNFARQNIIQGWFYKTTLTNADFTGAYLSSIYCSESIAVGANLSRTNGSHAFFGDTNLANANFSQANLTKAVFTRSMLVGANLSGADLTDAWGADVDLNSANLSGAKLTGATWISTNFENSNLSGVDARGALWQALPSSTIATNLIYPNGHMNSLDLADSQTLALRDYVKRHNDGSYTPYPIRVDQHFAVSALATLHFLLEDNDWNSTISFAPGISVTLNGTLLLEFAPDIDIASQYGRTFDLFDWTGVSPTGTFTISSAYNWDLSDLYTSGEVILLAPGDFDADGDVDGADFVAWQTNFPTASSATLAQGDADGDGDVDGADFVVWQTEFPFTPATGASPVSEPAGVFIFLTCALVTSPWRNCHFKIK